MDAHYLMTRAFVLYVMAKDNCDEEAAFRTIAVIMAALAEPELEPERVVIQ